MKSIKASDYVKMVKPNYVFFKVIPDTSVRNYNSSNIAKALSLTFSTINKRIKVTTKKYKWISVPTEIELTQLHKMSFMIDIQKNGVSFYFIVSDYFKNIAKEKISDIWPRATIEVVDSIQEFSKDVLMYELNYKKEDALSLEVDKRSNDPLSSILNVLSIMKDKDRIGVFYNFMPCNQLGWKKQYRETIDKVNKKLPVNKNKMDKSYVIMTTLNLVMEFIDNIIETICDFLGSTRSKSENITLLELAAEMLDTKVTISAATRKKKEANILDAQIMVLSESDDSTRKANNILSVCSSYRNVEGDNELIYKPIKENKNVFNMLDFKIAGVEEMKVSVEECNNFIQLPGRDILEQYTTIENKNVLETEVPKELQKGVMCIGNNIVKGNSQKAYLCDDKEYKYLTTCLVGPTRAGKTTLISNLSKDAINNNEVTILFDFCGNCKLSDDVSSVFHKNRILNIDCSDLDNLQGLGYNEIIPKNDSQFEVYRAAKTKTMQLMSLINNVNDDEDLKSRMERYLEAASVTVFLNSGSVKDVFLCLQDYVTRQKFIDSIEESQRDKMAEYVLALKELDDKKVDKDGKVTIVGTRISYVQSILNRISKFKQNAYVELMLNKGTEDNINLVDELQKSQLICLRMPEVMFNTEAEKDMYCTYWLTKIWGALQIRQWSIKDDKLLKINLIVDELYQVPKFQEFLRAKLSQIAKFRCKVIISCHYLGQIKIIRDELKAANTSYMLISGCDKDNYKELKDELYPFELEDLLNLKRYNSMNLIKYEGGWAKFITELPKPIK